MGLVTSRSEPLARLSVLFSFLAWTVLACAAEESIAISPVSVREQLSVKIVGEFPHDPGAFTQGLLWYGGKLYESTGHYGRSSLRKVRLETGDVEEQISLPRQFFAEGLTKAGGELIQLTWREGVAFVYDLRRFRESRRMSFQGEGWGLTYDGKWLVMSDGSDVLTFRDPNSMAVWRQVPVTVKGRPVRFLNELEFAQGAVFANVWQKMEIMRIDPLNGKVTAVIDASSLLARMKLPPRDVLNGIAFAPERGTFFLTGKYWPKLFEVRFE